MFQLKPHMSNCHVWWHWRVKIRHFRIPNRRTSLHIRNQRRVLRWPWRWHRRHLAAVEGRWLQTAAAARVVRENPLVFHMCRSVFWLVVEPTPLKNMSSSVGIMKFPIDGKTKNKKTIKQPTSFCLCTPGSQRKHNRKVPTRPRFQCRLLTPVIGGQTPSTLVSKSGAESTAAWEVVGCCMDSSEMQWNVEVLPAKF